MIGFADEEGTRFNATLLGSRAVAGTFRKEVLDAVDRQGISMREALRRFDLDPERIGEAAKRREDVLAYAELHIEQGPVLEAEGLPVGVVTAINGANRYAVEIDGMAGHAGTVPMTLRQDAMAAAAECVLAVERRASAEAELVGTVGKLECLPGAVNVVPGKVQVHDRHPQPARRLAARRGRRPGARDAGDLRPARREREDRQDARREDGAMRRLAAGADRRGDRRRRRCRCASSRAAPATTAWR